MAPDGDGYLTHRQGSGSLLCCWACVSVLDLLTLIKTEKVSLHLTFLGEHNPKPEKPTLKDYTYIISGPE